ncbi:MAG: hypothetical protein ACI9JN_000249 [Bacteroidia bacterium]|jgi:hypothetical protein
MTKLSYSLTTLLLLFLIPDSYGASPIISINGSVDTTINVLSTYQDEGAKAYDAEDGNISAAIVVSGSYDTYVIGKYFLLYTITDSDGNMDSVTRTLRVVDTEKPVIKNDEANKSQACWKVQVQLQSVFVDRTIPSDNYSNGIYGPIFTYEISPANAQGDADVDTRTKGITTVTYTVTDESGNVTSQCIAYDVRDFQNTPLYGFQGEGDTTMIHVNQHWSSRMRYIDSINGNITSSLLRTTNLNTNSLGDYWVKYLLINARGERLEKTITLLVRDLTAPIISGKKEGVVQILINSTYKYMDLININDNYDATATLFDSLEVLYDDIDVSTLGLYGTVFQVTDSSGNKSSPFTMYMEVVTTLSAFVPENERFAKVYPNPVSDVLVINTKNANSMTTRIGLKDAFGKDTTGQLKQTNIGFILDVHSLAKGIYYLEIKVDGKVQHEKIMVR